MLSGISKTERIGQYAVALSLMLAVDRPLPLLFASLDADGFTVPCGSLE